MEFTTCNCWELTKILSCQLSSIFKLIEKCTKILPADNWEIAALNLTHNWDSSSPIQNVYKESSPWHPFSGFLLKITASCSGENRGVGCRGLCDSYWSGDRERKIRSYENISSEVLFSVWNDLYDCTVCKATKTWSVMHWTVNLVRAPTGHKNLVVLEGGGGAYSTGSYIQ